MALQIGSEISVWRCHNGHQYGAPSWIERDKHTCPVCAVHKIDRLKREVNSLNSLIRNLYNKIDSLTRSKVAVQARYKSILKKMKGKS